MFRPLATGGRVSVSGGLRWRLARKRERVTIRTVAEDSGVSVAAVSKVLRDAYGVSNSLRAKVQASMARLGYRPHAAARGMRGQTFTLGILLNDTRNPFVPDILDGVNTALSRTQYQALIGMGQAMAPIETALVDAMVDRQMDGIIMIGPRMSPRELAVVAARIPTVAIAHHEPTRRPLIPSTTTTFLAPNSSSSIW